MKPDSRGSQAMRTLVGKLRAYAAAEADPNKAFDLKMAGELIGHLERLTLQLAKQAEAPLHSGRQP